MFLAVLNTSRRFSAVDCQLAVAACAAQMRLHLAPLWSMTPAPVVYYPDPRQVPDGADQLVVLDDPDQAGALGYHSEDPHGKPYLRAFVAPVLDNGGSPLHTANSVSGVMSHEVCEWFVDRFCNLWADNFNGMEFAVEVCDPVENDAYTVKGVAVSNFVTPRYFDIGCPPGSQLDYLKKLRTPFTMTPGGYQIVRHADGSVEQRFGRKYPDWKKAAKEFPAARTYKRRVQATSAQVA